MVSAQTLKARRLGEFLVEKRKITGEQLIRAIQSQRVVGGRIGTCLLEMDVLSEEALLDALSEQLLVPAAQIDDLRTVAEAVLALLPAKVAVRCQAIPLTATNKEIRVATLNVQNLEVLDELAFCTNKRVVPLIANEVRIYEALERYYGLECPSRYGHLLDRLNRSRYMWDESAKVLLASNADPDVLWADPDDVFAEDSIIRPPSSVPPISDSATATPTARFPAPAATPVVQTPTDDLPAAVLPQAEESAGEASPEHSLNEARTLGETGDDSAKGDDSQEGRPLDPTQPEFPPDETHEQTPAGASDSLTLEEVDQIFAEEPDRHTIGEIVIHFLAQTLPRCALFKIQHGKVQGWVAHGADLDSNRFLGLEITLAEPSVFHNLECGLPIHYGPLALLPAHQVIESCWAGELGRTCIMIPIRVRKRLVCALFGEVEESDIEIDLLPYHSLAEKVGMALELCILRRKLAER